MRPINKLIPLMMVLADLGNAMGGRNPSPKFLKPTDKKKKRLRKLKQQSQRRNRS